MDDGFQNPTIFKDKSIVVVDGKNGIGNGRLLPSGALRETISSAIKRASFFIIVNKVATINIKITLYFDIIFDLIIHCFTYTGYIYNVFNR